MIARLEALKRQRSENERKRGDSTVDDGAAYCFACDNMITYI